MEIVDTQGESDECYLNTPDASFFIPSPRSDLFPSAKQSFENDKIDPSSAISRAYSGEFSGLKLDRYAVHQGRLDSDGDTSLLEALVESAFDDFKSVRVVSEGAESVHAFVRALSEEFLNCGSAVSLENMTVLSSSESRHICKIHALYPAIPRFRHLAQIYEGFAVSERSMLEASLNAACNAIGRILLTFQPEGFELPKRMPSREEKLKEEESPAQSTVDSMRGSSLFGPVYIPESPRKRGLSTRLRGFFACGSSGRV